MSGWKPRLRDYLFSELSPGEVSDAFGTTEELLETGRAEEALVFLTCWAARSPGEASLHALLAAVQLHLCRFDEATRSADTARQLDPSNPAAQMVSAEIALGVGEIELALPLLRQAIILDTTDLEKWLTLLTTLKVAERWEELIDVAAQALRIHRAAAIHVLLCEALEAKGRVREALQSLARARDLEPSSVELTLTEARIRAQIGEDTRAMALAYDVESSRVDPPVLFELARLYLELRQTPAARRVMKRLHELDPALANELYSLVS